MPTRIERYKDYRQVQKDLNSKVVKSLDSKIFKKAARSLGILEGNKLMLESERELDNVMDFALNDFYEEGKNTVLSYFEKNQNELTKKEIEILNAELQSYLGLFRVKKVNPKLKKVRLLNLFDSWKEVEIIDIGLSSSLLEDMLIFTRIVPLKPFNITSGVAFIFDDYLEEELEEEYRKIYKNLKINEESAKQFVCFFKLNREYGYDVS